MEDNNLDEFSMDAAKDAAVKVKDKAVDKVKNARDAVIRERKETMLAAKILINILRRREASDKEIQFLKKQSIDIAKIVGLMGLQFIPLATSALILLKTILKKYGINFSPLPTSNKDIIDVSKELEEIRRQLNEVVDRHVVRGELDRLKIGDFITVNRYGKESVVFFSGKKGDDYYATTWRPGENQTKHDNYFKLYPDKNVDLIKIGNKGVESKDDFEDRKHFYNQEKYKDAYAHSKRHPNINEIMSERKKVLENQLEKVKNKLQELTEFDYEGHEKDVDFKKEEEEGRNKDITDTFDTKSMYHFIKDALYHFEQNGISSEQGAEVLEKGLRNKFGI